MESLWSKLDDLEVELRTLRTAFESYREERNDAHTGSINVTHSSEVDNDKCI